MFAHNRLNGFRGLVCVIEGNGRNVVVKNVSLDDTVEEGAADETELAVDRRGGTTGEGPLFRLVVRKGRIGMLKIGDCDCYGPTSAFRSKDGS